MNNKKLETISNDIMINEVSTTSKSGEKFNSNNVDESVSNDVINCEIKSTAKNVGEDSDDVIFVGYYKPHREKKKLKRKTRIERQNIFEVFQNSTYG